MNTVVNQLIDVDKQARSILDDAQQYYDRTIADIETEKQRIATEYEDKAIARLNEIFITEETAVTEATKQLKQKYSKLTSDMDSTFENEHVNWEKDIFDKCVRR